MALDANSHESHDFALGNELSTQPTQPMSIPNDDYVDGQQTIALDSADSIPTQPRPAASDSGEADVPEVFLHRLFHR